VDLVILIWIIIAVSTWADTSLSSIECEYLTSLFPSYRRFLLHFVCVLPTKEFQMCTVCLK
jgi:hypothetical protein